MSRTWGKTRLVDGPLHSFGKSCPTPLRDERQDAVHVMTAIWTTEGDAILHCVDHRDFQEFMKCRSGNSVFLVMNTQDRGTLFAPSLTGDLFQED